MGMMLLPFVLILKEPDLGSALVLLPTGLVMMLVAGTPRQYLLRLVGGVGVVAVLFLADVLFAPPRWQIPMQDYQRQRLLVYFGARFCRRPTPRPQERAAARRAATGKVLSSAAGADFRRLGRLLGQGLAARASRPR